MNSIFKKSITIFLLSIMSVYSSEAIIQFTYNQKGHYFKILKETLKSPTFKNIPSNFYTFTFRKRPCIKYKRPLIQICITKDNIKVIQGDNKEIERTLGKLLEKNDE